MKYTETEPTTKPEYYYRNKNGLLSKYYTNCLYSNTEIEKDYWYKKYIILLSKLQEDETY